jgi:hypothetical protein
VSENNNLSERKCSAGCPTAAGESVELVCSNPEERCLNSQDNSLFDTIESARDYISLLTEVVSDVRNDLESDMANTDNSPFPRKLDAIRLAAYNLEKLQFHLNASKRILNTLRSIQRLLFQERLTTLRVQIVRSVANGRR